MAKGPRYRVPLRRRREGRTNYYQRRELLKSGKTRCVIRKSSKHIIIQFVDAKPDGDIVLSGTKTTHLKDFGWKVGTGSIPASYVAGYLAGKRALKAGISDAVLDMGLQVNAYGGRVYAALKGVIDAGVNIPASEKIFPEDDVIHGSHIKRLAEWMKKERKEDYDNFFAGYLKAKQDPTKLDKLVDSVKGAIDKKF